MKADQHFVILGADGQLAHSFIENLKSSGSAVTALGAARLDITDHGAVRKALEQARPDVIINCAAYNRVDDAEDQRDLAFQVNAKAVSHLAQISRDLKAVLVHFSTDYVFDGTKGSAYIETDTPRPLNVYGASKLEGERLIAEAGAEYLILRLSWLFGFGRNNFLHKMLEKSASRPRLEVVDDEISVPTYAPDVVELTLAALERKIRGLYHVTNSGACSRYELAKYYLGRVRPDSDVVPVKSAAFPTRVRRPLNSAMSNARIAAALGRSIAGWQDAVERYINFKHVKKT